jgi:methylphosphotriester-DNA--protein-cysteine methyltransferase
MAYSTSSARWRAVCSRDASANGVFVYAVLTTRIYCRPNCAARLARRANVDFYDTAALAEAAGFRACKRCKPEEVIVPDPLAKVVADACAAIEKAVADGRTAGEGKITLNEIAKSVGLTPRYLHKVFKERMGVTPRQYANGLMAANQVAAGSSSMPSGQGSGGAATDLMGVDPMMASFDINAHADQTLLGSPFDLVAWDLCSNFPSLDGIFNQPLMLETSATEPLSRSMGFPTPSESLAGTPAATPNSWP